MRIVFTLLFIAFSALSIRADTVTGFFPNSDGTPFKGSITFQPKSNPQQIGTNTLAGASITTNLIDGKLNQPLLAGKYTVRVGQPPLYQFTIDVPGDGGTYSINSLSTNLGTYVYTNGNAIYQTRVSATDTTSAFLGAKLVAGTGIALSTNNPSGNSAIVISANGAGSQTPIAQTVNYATHDLTNAGTIQSSIVVSTNLKGNSTYATNAGTADFATEAGTAPPSGDASGDLGGFYPSPSVSQVGGVSAANVATGAASANGATSANTPNTIVKRDSSGDFSAGTITANLNGPATSASNTVAAINAKAFGAIGNGSADDTTAIQNAINAAESTGAIAYLPRGTYLITDTLRITNLQAHSSFITSAGSGIGIVGDGATLTTIKMGTPGKHAIVVSDVTLTNNSFFWMGFQGFDLYGMGYTNMATAIWAGTNNVSPNHWLIQNCAFEGWSNGFYGDMEDFTIRDCHFDKNSVAVYLNGTGLSPNVNNSLINCEIVVQNTTLPTPTSCIGVHVHGGTYQLQHLDIGDFPMNPAILIDGNAMGEIKDCSFEIFDTAGTPSTAIYLAGWAASVENSKFVGFSLVNTNSYPVVYSNSFPLSTKGNAMLLWPSGSFIKQCAPGSLISSSDPLKVDYWAFGTNYNFSSYPSVIPDLKTNQFDAINAQPFPAAKSTYGLIYLLKYGGSDDDHAIFNAMHQDGSYDSVDWNQYNLDKRDGLVVPYGATYIIATNGATFTASGTQGTNAAYLAFDQNTNTFWWNPGPGGSLQIDYGSGNSNKVNECVVGITNMFGVHYKVQASQDATTWNTLWTYGFNWGAYFLGNGYRSITNQFPNNTYYRYYRLLFDNSNDLNSWTEVCDWNLYGNRGQMESLTVRGQITGDGSGLTNLFANSQSVSNLASYSPTNYYPNLSGATRNFITVSNATGLACPYATNGPGACEIIFRGLGATNYSILIPANFVPVLQTNLATSLSGTNWVFTLTNGTIIKAVFEDLNGAANPNGTNTLATLVFK